MNRKKPTLQGAISVCEFHGHSPTLLAGKQRWLISTMIDHFFGERRRYGAIIHPWCVRCARLGSQGVARFLVQGESK